DSSVPGRPASASPHHSNGAAAARHTRRTTMRLGNPDPPIRRAHKAIVDIRDIEAVLHKALVVRIAMCDGDQPYIVPVNFAYHAQRLYIHSARKGRKIDILRANPKVCFETDVDIDVIEPADPAKACDFGMRFRSVVGTGTVEIHEDLLTVAMGLDLLMARFTDRTYEYPEAILHKTAMLVVKIDEVSGKQAGMA
ncbi:MAG: pyridoxamine 5'-phosphate oxidase family protein, partial [Oceanidesulfovibrio sp.]